MGQQRGGDGGSASPFLHPFGEATLSNPSLFSDSNPFRRKTALPQIFSKEGATGKLDHDEAASKKPRKRSIHDDSENDRATKAEKKKSKKIENPKIQDEAKCSDKKKKKRSQKEDEVAAQFAESRKSPPNAFKEDKRSDKPKRSASSPLSQLDEEGTSRGLRKKAKRVDEQKDEPVLKRMKKSKIESIEDQYLKSRQRPNAAQIQGEALKAIKKDSVKMGRSSGEGTEMLKKNRITEEMETIENDRVAETSVKVGRISREETGTLMNNRKSKEIKTREKDRVVNAQLSVKVGRSSREETEMLKKNGKTEEIKTSEEDGAENAKLSDNEKLKRTIFVGNLPLHLKKKALIREFSQYGAVDSARLRSVPLVDTKLPRKAAVITGHLNESRTSVNAYIVFKEQEAAKAALSHNMKEIHERHIRVDLAQAPHIAGKDNTSVNYDSTRSIFIGNLPFDAEDEEVYRLFSTSQNPDIQVEAVRIVRDRQTSIGKGFAFVLFKTKAALNFALSRGTLTLRERVLRLRRISSSKHKHTGAFSTSGAPAKKSSHMFKNKKSSLDQRAPKHFKERGQKLLSKSVQPYEGVRSTIKQGKPARWTTKSQRPSSNIVGKGSFTGNRASNSSPRVDVKKKRPAMAARKNLVSKKTNATAKNKSSKAGGAGKVKKSKTKNRY